jgi:uncharacterized protein (TIGR04551 family)
MPIVTHKKPEPDLVPSTFLLRLPPQTRLDEKYSFRMSRRYVVSKKLIAVLSLISLSAFAQVDAGIPVANTVAPTVETPTDTESLRRDFEARLDASKREMKELREEMRARLENQSVAQGWQENWVDEKRKLELVTFDGYLRVRPELFYKYDMGRGADTAGYTLWPRSPRSAADRTNAGINMRFRFEPTINVSEEVRVRAQIDALDNLVWGTTPDYAYSRNAPSNYWNDRNEFSIFSQSQVPQKSGINSFQDSIAMKRVWGEVSTPVGILRFGRMGSHWGLGMLYNDGNGIDNDWGDTVDRVSFTAEPLPGFYVTPMIDINLAGLTSVRQTEGGQPFDLSRLDDSTSYILAAARRDTDSERLAKLDTDGTVFNYGVHFSYRVQNWDATDSLSQPFGSDGTNGSTPTGGFVRRNAQLFIPDVWAKIEKKNFRVEGEFAAILGSITNRALSSVAGVSPGDNQSLFIYQFGGTLQGEYKLLNGDLEIGGEVGFASGDSAPGFGNYPRRKGSGPNGTTAPGDTDGPQYNCSQGGGCADNEIWNFRFNRDYRADMILYREILGGITDSLYIKPKIKYRITQGFEAWVAGIYSRALTPTSVPSIGTVGTGASLGIELNGGVKYETEDGFFGQVQYGVLFPLEGFKKIPNGSNTAVALDIPQVFRAVIGIKF